jgi:hypothetical protein
MDANEDVRQGPVSDMVESLAMQEAILEKHSSASPPATYNRNHQRQPIDGIWVSAGVEIHRAGYLEFGGASPSNHWALWIDFHLTKLFGSTIMPTVRPNARRLKAKDPRLVAKYNSMTKQAFKDNKLFSWLSTLMKAIEEHGFQHEHEIEFNSIHEKHTSLRKSIEQQLRKLKMGGVPWSPKLQKYRDAIELWWMVFRKRKSVKVSTKRVRRFMKRLGNTNALQVSLEYAERELKMARIAYKAAKTNADMWRDEHILSLAEARAEERGTTVEAEEKTLKHHARQKHQAYRIKAVRNKLRE